MSECRYEIMSALAGNNPDDPLVRKIDQRVGALTASLVRRAHREQRIPKKILIMRPRTVLCEVALDIFVACLRRVDHAPVVEVIDGFPASARVPKSAAAKSGP